uniref:Tubulin-specific chaperone D n=1 Tax=Romanomermis culicivorax TaxID=13658 RepID=A0A915KTH0_ROMCU
MPVKLFEQNLLTGIGADVTKYGVNFLISSLSQITPENSLNVDHCRRWFEILYENLGQNSSSSQDDAAAALRHFCFKTKNFDEAFKDTVLEKFLGKLENPVDEMDCIVGIIGVKNSVSYFVDCKEKTAKIVAQIKGIFDVVKPEYLTWAIARSRCIEAFIEIGLQLLALQESDASLISKIIESILTGFDDYTSNSKGDTGFFVRQATVQAVSKFLSTVEESRVDDQLREKSVCKLLKSVFDRNDILRLNSFDVLKSINFDHSSGFDHLSPEFYDNLTDLLDDPVFGPFILHGMIWMIGSTTESVSKIAVDALLSYLNDIRENEIALQFFVQSLINFCYKVENGTNNALNESISLLKTLDVVFSSNFVENYTKESDLEEILKFLRKQMSKTKNRQKLISGSQVLCSMLQFSAEMPNFTQKCLKLLFETFLVHHFPFVRKKTAENLYEALLNYGQLDNHTEWILTMLTDTDWSNKEKNEELRENVDKLKDVLLLDKS